MLSPLVKLATSAAPGEAKYVCLAGAGLSKDAGLPTAWDLMLDTAAILRAEEGDDGTDLQSWFLGSKYKDMKYSDLIGGMYRTSVEQQDFIRQKLKADKPGKSHMLLAQLARRKVVRCIITTNFDDLIEQALRQVGLNVQVIANDEDLKHSGPLIHCKPFRVYKPHGTIGVGRLRNTPADLEKLSGRMENELVRVTRDHGLIVLGYSGGDESILKVLRKRRHQFYPAFWVNPSEPAEGIPPLFSSETFNYIPCKGASAALGDLIEMYRKLASLAPTTGLPASVVEVRDAVRSGRADASATARTFMATFTEEVGKLAPDFSSPVEFDDALVEALDRVKPLCCEFAAVANTIAECDALDPAKAVYKGFSNILDGYYLPPGTGGHFSTNQFDYFKFLGHELMTMLASALIQQERWESLREVLSQGVIVKNPHDGTGAGLVSFEYASEHVQSLDIRNRRLGLRRVSLHSDILRERHTDGELARLSPHDIFMEADYLLAMQSLASAKPDALFPMKWGPWSVLHMPAAGPKFLMEAKSKNFASRLALLFGKPVEDLPQLVRGIQENLPQLFRSGVWHYVPPACFDPRAIGSL